MRGVVYTELVGFLDKTGGQIFAEEVLSRANLPHGGAYSPTGYYPWEEAVRVVGVAAELGEIDMTVLCRAFGEYLFERFAILYAEIVGRYSSAEALLAHVNDHIHHEVRALHPRSAPPSVVSRSEGDTIVITYASHRPFAHIAHGLVSGVMKHFGDTRDLDWIGVSDDCTAASFAISGTQQVSACPA
ncbi:heme NO-binding domain-containing protein [Croceicoccus sp. YJ47]|uniref:heme NO-binding domain-containing protein n=1 Tax=Croceicoccus sp. YJ47 TaxID=2798724 RepID=UPI001923BA18|nr:heme NO-binding domain-containing protein [Croceicoccus sp. YJ47]QQN74459.1 heme NO-binding domain-containing protein [Croceicoccus sp. YJ47]